MDDFDVEVSGLQTTPDTPAVGSSGAEPRAPADRSTASPPPSSAAHAPLSSPPRRTQRLLRAVSLLVLLLLLLSALLLVPTENRASIGSLLVHPTVTPTPVPRAGDDAFLWEHSVPWGQLQIDGKAGPDVRGSAVHYHEEGVPASGVPFHLARGRHTLAFRAAPFPTLTCTLSVPFAQSDTCPLDQSTDFSSLVPSEPATRLLDLQATINRLPRAQQGALFTATQAAVTSLASTLPFGTVAVGDHYLDQNDHITQASSAMRIEPKFHLDVATAVTCGTLCSATGLFDALSADEWDVLAPVVVMWRYVTPAGQVVVFDSPGLPTGVTPYTLVRVRARWSNNAWQNPTAVFEVPETDPVICPTGMRALTLMQVLTVGNNYAWPSFASIAELGCVYAGSEVDFATGNFISPMALVLYRAGALIAVNAQARHIFPDLPVASDHERGLAIAVAPTSLE